MLSRETFVNAINGIKKHEAIMEKLHDVAKELGDFPPHLDFDEINRRSLVSVLKESMNDRYDYIGWWLYEASDYTVSWTEGEQEIERDLTDVNALYDYLGEENQTIPFERLPIREHPNQTTGILPQKIIDKKDFLAYFDRVLDYMDSNDVALHIQENGGSSYVLLSYKCYQQMQEFSKDKTSVAPDDPPKESENPVKE